jgi:hypothetical protein
MIGQSTLKRGVDRHDRHPPWMVRPTHSASLAWDLTISKIWRRASVGSRSHRDATMSNPSAAVGRVWEAECGTDRNTLPTEGLRLFNCGSLILSPGGLSHQVGHHDRSGRIRTGDLGSMLEEGHLLGTARLSSLGGHSRVAPAPERSATWPQSPLSQCQCVF